MSQNAYDDEWARAQAELEEVLQQDVRPTSAEDSFKIIQKDRQSAFQLVANMYVKYTLIFRRLENSYDQIVHPQKRRTIREVLDGTMGRLLELKHELVALEHSEYHYFDDIYADLKLTPSDVELRIPRYFVREKSPEQKEVLSQISLLLGDAESVVDDGLSFRGAPSMSREAAILMIQRHERARQGRLRAKFVRDMKKEETRGRVTGRTTSKPVQMDLDAAATILQKTYRGFLAKRKTKQMREEEFVFLGMALPPHRAPGQQVQQVQRTIQAARHDVQDRHEEEYQAALTNIKARLLQTEGPDIKETLQDQIRQWFLEVRDATGKFPDFPDEDEGGSAGIFKPKDPSELEIELQQKLEEDIKGKKEKKKGETTTRKEKRASSSRRSRLKKDDDTEFDEGYRLKDSKFVDQMTKGSDKYRAVWKDRNEKLNLAQKHEVELIKEEKREEVEDEVRMQVDELMREELKSLKLALDKDRGRKGKPGKKKKKGKKAAGKKGKKGKRRKTKT